MSASAKKSHALVVDAVVSDGKVKLLDEFGYRAKANRACEKWGEGTELKLRIETKDDAVRHAQRKHLHGHLFVPASEVTGYSVAEIKDEMRARFLPEDWMTSTEDMSNEQYREFIDEVERCLQEEWPLGVWEACQSAMALSDYRQSA